MLTEEDTIGLPEKISKTLATISIANGIKDDFKSFLLLVFLLITLPIAHPTQEASNTIGSAISTHITPSILVKIKNIEKTAKLIKVPNIACLRSGNNPEDNPMANGKKKNNPIPKSANPLSNSISAIDVNEIPTMKLILNDVFLLFIMILIKPNGIVYD